MSAKKTFFFTCWALLIVLMILAIHFTINQTKIGSPETTNAKKIILGTSPEYPPFEDIDIKNGGEIVGLDIDIAKSISKKLGYEMEIVSFDFNGLITALQSHRVDFVLAGLSATPKRKESVAFTTGYYTPRNTILSRRKDNFKTLKELEGKAVGAQLGSIQEQVIKTIPRAKSKALNKTPDLLEELHSERIDAIVLEDSVAVKLQKDDKSLSLALLPANKKDSPYAIALPKGSMLVEKFNKILQEMNKSGELKNLVDKWFHPPKEEKDLSGGAMSINFAGLKAYFPYIFEGIYVTLLFTLVATLFGLVLGSMLSLFKISKIKPLRWFSTGYTSIFRGTPLLVQLSLIYYAFPQLFNFKIPALWAAGLAFGLNSAAYLSETIRGGIMGVDKGQREAAISLGMPYGTMMLFIIFPQALRIILPAIVNEIVSLIKESSLVSVIGVADLMRRADIVRASTYRSFEVLFLVAAVYYLLVLSFTSFAHLLERKLGQK